MPIKTLVASVSLASVAFVFSRPTKKLGVAHPPGYRHAAAERVCKPQISSRKLKGVITSPQRKLLDL